MWTLVRLSQSQQCCMDRWEPGPSCGRLCHGIYCAGQATWPQPLEGSARVAVYMGRKTGHWISCFWMGILRSLWSLPTFPLTKQRILTYHKYRCRILHLGTGSCPYVYLLPLKAAACHLVPLQCLCHPFTCVLESTSTTWNTVVCTGPNSSARGHDWSIHIPPPIW